MEDPLTKACCDLNVETVKILLEDTKKIVSKKNTCLNFVCNIAKVDKESLKKINEIVKLLINHPDTDIDMKDSYKKNTITSCL